MGPERLLEYVQPTFKGKNKCDIMGNTSEQNESVKLYKYL